MSLSALPHSKNHFLASKADGQIYVFRVSQNSIPDDTKITFNTNEKSNSEVSIEFYLVDTIEQFLANKPKEEVRGMFNGAKVSQEIMEKVT